jgi:cyclic beta-1,2-glucan synthetase
VQVGNQQQAADQVSISNSIGSLRSLGAMTGASSWKRMSAVEHTLREDPGGVYGRMDFATRDRYRHVVEKVAKNSSMSEAEVARHALDLAREGAAGRRRRRAAHVGFYLIDRGCRGSSAGAKACRCTVESLQRRRSAVPLVPVSGRRSRC